ncbi:MAG: prepilin-type cleavage/methylation domain-containing protein [Betaproteobacteria bacterium]|nr:prepilin-type cleavage/methylation domain-containing protein [Betaproteobacteria bacterium]
MRKQRTSQLKSVQQGVVIIEAMIAILIFSVGVLGIVGLQASMIKNTADSKYRADAGYIAQQWIGMMWTDPNNLATYPGTTTDISSILPGGSLTVTQPAAGQFTITVTWQKQGESQHNYTTTASITGG